MALALGMTPARLLDELDSADLVEWMAYDRIEPFGAPRADLQAAIVAQTVAASVGADTKLEDYLPRFEEPQEDRESYVVDKLKLWAAALRANQERNGVPGQ